MAFDALHVWLGIPPKDQPPNLYRLLGIERFEHVPNVIEHAADRQMAHVRACAAGHPEESQRLLNDLARARAILLDDLERSHYDASIGRVAEPPIFDRPVRQVPRPPPVPMAPPAPILESAAGEDGPWPPYRSIWRWICEYNWAIGAIILLAIAGILLASAWSDRFSYPSEVAPAAVDHPASDAANGQGVNLLVESFGTLLGWALFGFLLLAFLYGKSLLVKMFPPDSDT